MDNNTPYSDYVPVYVTMGRPTGEMVRLFLEANQIPAILLQESAGVAMGLTVGSLGEVTVLVPADLAALATELLDSMEQGAYEVSEDDANAEDAAAPEDEP